MGATKMPAIPMASSTYAMLDLAPSCVMWSATSEEMLVV
jgi:hypothetical protein